MRRVWSESVCCEGVRLVSAGLRLGLLMNEVLSAQADMASCRVVPSTQISAAPPINCRILCDGQH